MLLSWSTTLQIQLSLLLNMYSRGTLLASLNSSIVLSSIIFYHVTPIFLESESIWFCASPFMSPTFSDYGKYVLRNNLNEMGGICKEGRLWVLIITFSFGLLQNLTSGNFGWMLEHISHCAVIVTENEINDKEAIIECILYHLQNCRSLHTFWASLEVLWEIMFFCFFSSLFCSIAITAGLGI